MRTSDKNTTDQNANAGRGRSSHFLLDRKVTFRVLDGQPDPAAYDRFLDAVADALIEVAMEENENEVHS